MNDSRRVAMPVALVLLAAAGTFALTMGARQSMGLFVSPIAFTSANVPEAWRPRYALNPMVGIIDGFRWSLLNGAAPPPVATLVACVAFTALILLAGVVYFRRMERDFADVI